MTGRVQHAVLFRFPRDLTREEEREMFEQVGRWPEAIPGLTGLRFGSDVSGRSAGYRYLLLTEFEGEEAHRRYYDHPAHLAFSEWVMAREPDIIRVDYALTEETLLLG